LRRHDDFDNTAQHAGLQSPQGEQMHYDDGAGGQQAAVHQHGKS